MWCAVPATFVIEPERRLVRSRAWGVIVDADLQGTQRGVREDPRFDPHFRQIYDFTEVTQVRLTGACVRALAGSSPFARDARRAIVVASDVAFGMARMYMLVSDRDSSVFRIFRDLAAAERWLDAEADAAVGERHAR